MALARTGVEVEVEVDVDFDRADDGFDAVVARLPVVAGRRGADPPGRDGAGLRRDAGTDRREPWLA
ncbi:MAG: hypothetical protein H0U01_00870 [Acidimicrobiia bacterium]|nr:hypothetical protein [Acidimicrobiia bacterium]